MIQLGIQLIARQDLPYIEKKKRYEHLFCIGGTGSGKTTFFLNLINADLDAGMIILDPSGDLADKVVKIVPPERITRVTKTTPLSLNPLSRPHLNKSESSNELVEIVNSSVQAYSQDQAAITVKMTRIVRQAISVMGGDFTIEALSEFLDSYDVRRKHFIDEPPNRYWREFDSKGYKYEQLRMSAERVTDRFSLLFEDENLYPFVMGKNELDIPEIAREKRIVIFDLKGLDDELTIFIGNLVSHQIKSYYLHQAKTTSPPLYFYCDEFHLFISKLFGRFLVESRKFNISVNLAGHSLGQADKKLLPDLLNCHVIAVLSANYEDAERLAKEMRLKAGDLMDLGRYEAYLSIGKRPVKIMALPPPKERYDYQEPEPKEVEKHYFFLRAGWLNC